MKFTIFLQLLTEHQLHFFGGILVLAVFFFGLLGLLIFLDRRGIKTHLTKAKNLNREEQRKEKRLAKKRRHRR